MVNKPINKIKPKTPLLTPKTHPKKYLKPLKYPSIYIHQIYPQ